ncbi:hypothetical protein LVD15_17630 [Fulvivirga maritima]|uniref:hypothetical protein n=1 Tax=Fulvivirga maritima TaxID=2904247 RepID=UPI001F1C6A89|nr:hypothetical protein [Fulvivirga maritima]UII25118.1 hypothetical protein LVD15_17630 [Fulvivirga maritima]
MNCWQTLNIQKTSDQKAIKKTYARLLPLHHPEKDREGYQQLRMAFNEALKIAKSLSEVSEQSIDMSLVNTFEQPQEVQVEFHEEAPKETHPLEDMYKAYFRDVWDDHESKADTFSDQELGQLLQYTREQKGDDAALNAFLIHVDYTLSKQSDAGWKEVFGSIPFEMSILDDRQLSKLTSMLMTRADLPKEFWDMYFENYPAVDVNSWDISTFKSKYEELIKNLRAAYNFTTDPLFRIIQTGLSVLQNRRIITHQRQIYFHILEKNWAAALAYADELPKKHPEVSIYYRVKLTLLDKLQQPEKALAFANSISSELLKQSWELEKYKADLLARTGQYEAALDIYQRLYETHMTDSDLYMSIIHCSVHLGSHLYYNLDLAKTFSEQNPAHLGITHLIRICEEQIIIDYLQSKNRQSYLEVMDSDDLKQLIEILLKNNLLEETEQVLKDAPELEEKEAFQHQWKVLQAIHQENEEEAMKAMDLAFRSSVTLGELNSVFLRFFEYLERRGKHEDIYAYTSLFLSYPLSPEILLYFLKNLGRTAEKNYLIRSWPQLSVLFDKMHTLFPYHIALYTSEAKCLVKQELFKEAITVYNNLLDSPLRTNDDDIIGFIAQIYENNLNDPDKAAIYYKGMSNELRRDINMAYARHNNGQYDEALELYLKHVDKFEDKYWIYRDIGACACSGKNFEVAIEYLEKALEKDYLKKNQLDVREMLADIYNSQGEHQKCFETLIPVEEEVTEQKPLAFLGLYYRLLAKDHQKAARFYFKIYLASNYNTSAPEGKFVGMQLLAYSGMLYEMGGIWNDVTNAGRIGFMFLEGYSKLENATFEPRELKNMVAQASFLEDEQNAAFLFPFLQNHPDQSAPFLTMELKQEFPILYHKLYANR